MSGIRPATAVWPDRRLPGWHRVSAAVRRVGDAVGNLPGPAAQTVSWSLPVSASSVPQARRLTRAWLAAYGLNGFGDVVELLVSELVTNAYQHAPGPCRVGLSLMDGLLRCEAEDTSAALPRLRDNHTWDEGGRGLHLIDMLACCWGSVHTPTGKTVWFELPTTALGPA